MAIGSNRAISSGDEEQGWGGGWRHLGVAHRLGNGAGDGEVLLGQRLGEAGLSTGDVVGALCRKANAGRA